MPLNFFSSSAPAQPADAIAQQLVLGINQALRQRVQAVQIGWRTLWESPAATPAEILAALGTSAARVLQAGALATADLAAIAAAQGTTTAALLGGEKYLGPKVPLTVNADGTVSITPPPAAE